VPGGVYHVYARGNRRAPIFRNHHDRQRYLAIWGSVVQDLGWRCLAYCLMDNHVHHLVETPKPDLPAGVQLAHGMYGRYFNDSNAECGHVFQGRFGCSRAKTTGTLWYFASYVVLNPVRASMCERPEQHRWSSHAAVLGAAPGPWWLAVDRLLSFFESSDSSPLERYTYVVDAIRIMGAAGFEPATSRV
jgi:REP element-mobilizing transposase RayT